MDAIYFVDDQHKLNFKRVLLRWPMAKDNMEYMTACYILALPMIFEKVEEYIGTFEEPVDWIWRWEWKYTLLKTEEYKEYRNKKTPDIPYDLTNSAVQLGKFSLNMWNGYEHFNLMDCIARLDEENYKVTKCAIDMRMRKLVGTG